MPTLLEIGRSHTCGALRSENVGDEVILMGWVGAWRDLGGRRFIDLRDRYGVTQVTFGEELDAQLSTRAKALRSEWVIAVRGVVEDRVSNGGTVNDRLATGAVEVRALSLEVQTESETPPFQIAEAIDTREELRLKYRYLDLRRGPLQRNLLARHRFNQSVRTFMDGAGFLELETPFLIRSTPEGARDYVVPSRVHKGTFFALPQSPQLFKQLFMVAGFDKYYQLARCFRDEDLRADRQPEFTQVDVEMSFATPDRVFEVVEGLVGAAWKAVLDLDLPGTFERLTYAEAMARFGSDAPDMRFGMELVDVSETVAGCDFVVFSGALQRAGSVKAICLSGGAARSRKQIDAMTERVKTYGAKGLAYAKLTAEGWTGPIAKFFDADAQAALNAVTGGSEGDLLLFVADATKVANTALGHLRLALGDELGLRPKDTFHFCWVTDFPLFEAVDLEDGGTVWASSHHPFTAPHPDHLASMEQDPGGALSLAYDLVLNGSELGSGSIRIHDAATQRRIFSVLGLSEAEQQEKFGFLLDAFRYGPPPHGGMALGVDRTVMLMTGADSLREVIAFPKTARAQDLMLDAPGRIDDVQLAELALAHQGLD
jgi:aspartyl-tRNA synthetase